MYQISFSLVKGLELKCTAIGRDVEPEGLDIEGKENGDSALPMVYYSIKAKESFTITIKTSDGSKLIGFFYSSE
ncbi:hypothetical protein [Sporomusa sphaeroides]|uniref:Uncharacterized protein n=1 Tax=Sporomusa sphaeroides DSM 2875 TaxID=1337886 RepID=A0A1U7M9W8_9FIRM|nr:hypothetical protein [Sporomusa sphaeroides]OLS54350.1 hypothetical protein SPSPH_45960 [Sporomusa sphaeroides DSM 2875]CVK21646.1 hypothetical protein SSPH_04341 [Sporomusa sphaeroides DSM 2875]